MAKSIISLTDEEIEKNPLMLFGLEDEALLRGAFVAREPHYLRDFFDFPGEELFFRIPTRTPGDEETPRLDRVIKNEIRSIAAIKAARTRKRRMGTA